jgi:hypothetical protein
MDSLKLDWQVTVPVASNAEPVTLNDLRSTSTGSYLRVDFTDDDTVLSALISQCRADAERMTGKAFAPQTIQAMWTMPQINAGSLTGPQLLYEQDFYQYNESLGANPFSPAPFILYLPMPPLAAVSLFEYRTTAFTAWTTWPATTGSPPVNNYVVDTLPIPGVVYLQYPPPAYQYRLTYTCGYTTLPPELKLMLLQYIAWKYENRIGEDKSDELKNIFIGRKSWVL